MTADIPKWQYDEMEQVGRDYCKPEEVEIYDQRHAQFRNIEKANNEILSALDVKPEDTILELGIGTGALSIAAAQRCRKVYAADVSRPMLDYAKQKAADAGLTNIEFYHGGFLTYEHSADPVDIIVTCTALHHIPDYWKSVALRRLNKILKPGGQLFISDVIYEEDTASKAITQWIDKLESVGGADLREDAETHIREEYSTFDWIMEGLLSRTGFAVKQKSFEEGIVGRYLCVKEYETKEP